MTRQAYGQLVGGSYHGDDLGVHVQFKLNPPAVQRVDLPRRYSMEEARKLHEANPPRPGGPLPLGKDVYVRRTDYLGHTFWIEESLLQQ